MKHRQGSPRAGCETASESPQVRPWGQPRDRLTPQEPWRKQQSPEHPSAEELPSAEPAVPELVSSQLHALQPKHKDPLQCAVPKRGHLGHALAAGKD